MEKNIRVRRLTRENSSRFFRQTERNDIIVYDPKTFDLEDVYKLAYKNGWLLTYFPPGCEEYNQYGSATVKAMWRV